MNRNLVTLALILALGACSSDNGNDNTPATFSGVSTANMNNDMTMVSDRVSVSDPDEGESSFVAQSQVNTSYGVFSIDAEGIWSYELNTVHSEVTALNMGQTLTDTATVASVDGSTLTVTITISGTNTPASFSGDVSASTTNLLVSNALSGNISVNDPDSGESFFVSQTTVSTTFGSFSISADGQWQYTVDTTNSDVAALQSQTDTLTDSIVLNTIDGTSTNLLVTITGTDIPNASFSGDLTATILHTQSEDVTGAVTVTDSDSGESQVMPQTNISTLYGTFSITSAGLWSYSLNTNDTRVSALDDVHDSLVDSITITSTDGSSTAVVLTITGTGGHTDEEAMGFGAAEGGNHIDGYTDAVPVVNCTQTVSSISALEDAAEDLVAGDTLCLADGQYTGDFELRVEGQGSADAPITVAAENPGAAVISNGEMSVRIGGRHVVIQGFVFRDGESGSSIIKFEKDSECHFCRVTEVAVIDMDNGDFNSSKWIEYYGTYNRIDHSWFSGKESRGALLVLPRWIDESTFAVSGFPEDRAQIDFNYFGDRPPAWGRAYAGSSDNEYEGVRLGLSTTHSAPSYSVLENNYFERIQGEAEVISNKSANNTIRNNTIRDSHGSIVNRHGANVNINNNFVFGDDNPFSGGIRIVDDGHTVTNNYVQGARYLSSNWNGGIVLTTGDGAGDTENGYQNVENVLVAHNTIVDSVNSLNVYGGKESVAPKNIYFVNNIVTDSVGPVIRTNDETMPSGSTYEGNYVFGQAFSDNDDVNESNTSGFSFIDPMLEEGVDGLQRVTANSADVSASSPLVGDFSLPSIDMDGQARSAATTSGADEMSNESITLAPLTTADVGPKNYRHHPGKVYVQSVAIVNHDFDDGDLTGWSNDGGTGASIVSGDSAFSRDKSLLLNANAAAVSQAVALEANTNYTLSAFMKGSARLVVTINDQTYAAERTASTYGFSSVTFNSGSGTSAVLTAMVDDLVTNEAALLNSDFDDKQSNWTVVEGTGIGQVQDSSNSASGADGSIKFKWNVPDDSGTPHNPYIAQNVAVVANTDYTLSIYNLYKNDDDNSSILFGASTDSDVSQSMNHIASKDSIYSALKSAGTDKGDDSFYQDTLTFNTGNNTSITVFAQFNSSNGSEIRVDDFELSYQGAPADGTEAYFDNIRLVSHPLSEAESNAAEND